MLKIGSVSRAKTFHHDFLPIIELGEEMIDGKRYYLTPTGEKYPSVTTVLSTLSKEGIVEWRKRVGEEEAQKILTQATRRGTKVHKICERYILNEDNIGKGMMPTDIDMFRQIQPILDARVGTIYGSEIPLHSHKLKTAGRCDLVCEFDGVTTILDYKTSRKEKKEEWIQNYFLQASCYSMMLYEMYRICAPSIAVVIAVENEQPQVFQKNVLEFKDEVKLIFSQYHENNRQ